MLNKQLLNNIAMMPSCKMRNKMLSDMLVGIGGECCQADSRNSILSKILVKLGGKCDNGSNRNELLKLINDIGRNQLCDHVIKY